MANSENPARGRNFTELVRKYFLSAEGLVLRPEFEVEVGVGALRKPHRFDLGTPAPRVLVECKRHTWTEGANSPSAKLSVWNEAMYYFVAAPADYRQLLAVLRDLRNGQSLAEHYLSRFSHLVPPGVEIWEFDESTSSGKCLYVGR